MGCRTAAKGCEARLDRFTPRVVNEADMMQAVLTPVEADEGWRGRGFFDRLLELLTSGAEQM